MSHHPVESFNHSENEHFQTVLNRSLESPARRKILRGGFGLSALSSLSNLASIPLLAGLLGFGGMRSFEKHKGVAR
jgi:hypothetical protein